jgi:hypothetical protein
MPVTHSVSARALSLEFTLRQFLRLRIYATASLSDRAQRASAEHLGFVCEDETRDEQNKLTQAAQSSSTSSTMQGRLCSLHPQLGA